MRNIRDLKIWQKGIDIVTDVFQLFHSLPKEEMYGLRTQLQRAAVSIPSNIAEGCSRAGEIAVGSAYELETQWTIIEHVKLVSGDKIIPIMQLLTEEQKMLNSFISSIRNRNIKSYKP